MSQEDGTLDRRALIKVAAGGVAAAGLLATGPHGPGNVGAAFQPNNFHALVHITRQEEFSYAFSSLDTIAKHYKKATSRLVIDGDAVKGLTDDDILGQISSAKDAGAKIIAASDALSINGIDPETLPDYIDTDNTGVIAVVDAQSKGFHYYKL